MTPHGSLHFLWHDAQPGTPKYGGAPFKNFDIPLGLGLLYTQLKNTGLECLSTTMKKSAFQLSLKLH